VLAIEADGIKVLFVDPIAENASNVPPVFDISYKLKRYFETPDDST
jgi:hypothetical protein